MAAVRSRVLNIASASTSRLEKPTYNAIFPLRDTPPNVAESSEQSRLGPGHALRVEYKLPDAHQSLNTIGLRDAPRRPYHPLPNNIVTPVTNSTPITSAKPKEGRKKALKTRKNLKKTKNNTKNTERFRRAKSGCCKKHLKKVNAAREAAAVPEAAAMYLRAVISTGMGEVTKGSRWSMSAGEKLQQEMLMNPSPEQLLYRAVQRAQMERLARRRKELEHKMEKNKADFDEAKPNTPVLHATPPLLQATDTSAL
ncbi:hypothetical protein SISNIDRAFT_469348 [Sistotremastrum niveocremeum HHB9708]|uniref:Uncharacterized protein n=1 Tax=Sistotremastrum niveocremeum HHB9708 TaxID=1314777 RepID=A0A164Q3R9_9AGAM|nr:hypothetical protein SISNIDRAFT_469348 [Sistotremastrum niveocremeum HHB9708]